MSSSSSSGPGRSGDRSVSPRPKVSVGVRARARPGGSGRRSAGGQRALYGKHGVTEYWLVDPAAETVQIHRLQGDILIPTRTFGRKDTLRSPLLTGLELHLDDIFGP